jgi:hypothetical protein
MKGYDNPKMKDVLALCYGLGFTERDYAELAIVAADQAGLSARDQGLFEQLLTAALENHKHYKV